MQSVGQSSHVGTDLQVQPLIPHLVLSGLLPHHHDHEDQGKPQVAITT